MLKKNQSVCLHLSVCQSFFLCVSLFVCLFVYLSVFLFGVLFVCRSLPVCLSVCPSAWLAVCQSVRPSVRPSIYPSVYLSSVFLSSCLSACLSLFMRFSRNNDNQWMMWLHMPLHPAGIHSIFADGHLQLFSFKCCNSQKYIKNRCKWSKYVNSYGKNIIFEMTKKGFYMRGVRSYYSSFFK